MSNSLVNDVRRKMNLPVQSTSAEVDSSSNIDIGSSCSDSDSKKQQQQQIFPPEWDDSIPVDYQIKLACELVKRGKLDLNLNSSSNNQWKLPLQWPSSSNDGINLLHFEFPDPVREEWGRNLGHVYRANTTVGPVAVRFLSGETPETPVVVLEINKHQQHQQQPLDKYRTQFDLHRYLSHPSIVRCLSLVAGDSSNSSIYGQLIVSEWCERGSLFSHYLSSTSTSEYGGQLDWPMERRIKVAYQIADGMKYLHEQGIYNPLSTKSILLTTNWDAKISNAGLSPVLDDTGRAVKNWKINPSSNTTNSSNATNGSVRHHIHNRILKTRYLAPESNLDCGEKSSLSANVHSYGSILWELFRRPPSSSSSSSIVNNVDTNHWANKNKNKNNDNGRSIIPDYFDPQLKDLIISCWQTDPNTRPKFCEIVDILNKIKI